MKKTNFILTIRYEIPTFLSVGPFFKEGGGGLENFGQKLNLFWIFSIEVAPYKVILKLKQIKTGLNIIEGNHQLMF